MPLFGGKHRKDDNGEPQTRPIPLGCITCSGAGEQSSRCTNCLGWKDKTQCGNCGGGGWVMVKCPTCKGSGKGK